MINKRMFQLLESGHVNELLQRVLDNEKSIPLERDGDGDRNRGDFLLKPLKLGMYMLLFIGYAMGNVTAFIRFIFEFFNSHR